MTSSSWLFVTFLLCVALETVAARSLLPTDDVDTHDWALTPAHRRRLVLDGSKLDHRRHGDGDADMQLVTSLPAHFGTPVMLKRQ